MFLKELNISKLQTLDVFNTSGIFAGLRKPSELHVVKFFFSTPTMDIITKDVKANLMTKISTIGKEDVFKCLIILFSFSGGTMGLFAGFSIISGIEIIFFACKIFVGPLMQSDNK